MLLDSARQRVARLARRIESRRRQSGNLSHSAAGRPDLSNPFFRFGKRDLVEVFARDDAVQAHAVADFARNLQHPLLHRGDQHRDMRIRERRRREVRRHQREIVVLALKVERRAGLPGVSSTRASRRRSPSSAAPASTNGIPKRRVTWPLTCEPSPSTSRPPLIRCRSHAVYAVATGTLGERERDAGAEFDRRRLLRRDREHRDTGRAAFRPRGRCRSRALRRRAPARAASLQVGSARLPPAPHLGRVGSAEIEGCVRF